MSRPNNNNRGDGKGNNRQVRINEQAKKFAKASLKRYKKDNDFYDSKKELRNGYIMYLLDMLPKSIEFCVKYGYIPKDEVRETKNAIFAKINDPDFIKILKKELKNGNKIENIKLLPIMIKEILIEAKKANDEILAADPNGKIYDMSDLVELSQMIMKKKLKKMDKAGIPQNVAFDVCSIIPYEKALESSQFFRIHSFFDCLYEHAKTTAIPFAKLMDELVDPEYHNMFITFALLERKERFARLTDAQKTLYLDISTWCFTSMEKSGKNEIEAVVKTYVNSRKRDDAAGKDSNRRYALSSLSVDEYGKIAKVITKMIADDDSIKKYLS